MNERIRKAELVAKLMAVDHARRGQLSAQYYKRKTASGQNARQGPYYVWQRSVKGVKHSVRVSRDQLDRVEEDLNRGKEVQTILDELWSILEGSAVQAEQDAKKKPTRFAKRASGKPTPSFS